MDKKPERKIMGIKEINDPPDDIMDEKAKIKMKRMKTMKYILILIAVAGIFALALQGIFLKGHNGGQGVKPEDTSTAEESMAMTPMQTTSPPPTDLPEKAVHSDVHPRVAREKNMYLVYPDSYSMEMKSFPEDFTEKDKEMLKTAAGDYAYEEGFRISSMEYTEELLSNASDGSKAFGMTLNGEEGMYVTAVWVPAAAGSPDDGEYLFIMDRRDMEDIRESTTEAPDMVEGRPDPEGVTGTPSRVATPTPRPTATPTPSPTPTPVPEPTSDYRPDTMEIRDVPGEIADAVASVEEFRNSVYNFLYDNGLRATLVTADPYYEKYGDGVYDFRLNVSGRTIYARYDSEINEYYYSFAEFE